MDKASFNSNFFMCFLYGFNSILQTLNSRYLYQSLHFDYYSFIFAIQRIAIIVICYLITMRKKQIDAKLFLIVIPYSAVMCTSNILSSYCITIMPIAAFLAFKKFIILFILCISVLFHLPSRTNFLQHLCIFGIILGGALIGQKDILHGNIIGYISCLGFDLSDALSLQYAAFLFRKYHLQPQQLLFYNAFVSLPYYLVTILYEGEIPEIHSYLANQANLLFFGVFMASIMLASLSEFASSYIAMKISPVQKSTVSNIKDLLLTLISVYYFREFILTNISSTGLLLCLISSAIFANEELKHKTLQQLEQDLKRKQFEQIASLQRSVQEDQLQTQQYQIVQV